MDLDPVSRFNADPCGSGSTTMWASNVDPDPHEFGPLDPPCEEISCIEVLDVHFRWLFTRVLDTNFIFIFLYVVSAFGE
jgi:hypothetical protein